jgi:hypothetical protein
MNELINVYIVKKNGAGYGGLRAISLEILLNAVAP